MANIITLLNQILAARYGKDVRQSIHDAIYQCYKDGKSGAIDVVARESISNLENTVEEVAAIAKGRSLSLAFENYQEMIDALLSLDENTLKRGWNIYIGTVNVPDLWIYSVETTTNEYTYSTDDAIVSELKSDTTIQVGYYKLAMLETGKVDLTEYAKKSDLQEVEDEVSELNNTLDETNNILDNMMTIVGSHATGTIAVASNTTGSVVYQTTVGENHVFKITSTVTTSQCKGCDFAHAMHVNNKVVARRQFKTCNTFATVDTIETLIYLKKGDVIKVVVAQLSGSNADIIYDYHYEK